MSDADEPLSPLAADLVCWIAPVFLDEPADLMDQVHAAVSAAADEPLRSEPTLAAEVAASTRSNVLHWVRLASQPSQAVTPAAKARQTPPVRCARRRLQPRIVLHRCA